MTRRSIVAAAVAVALLLAACANPDEGSDGKTRIRFQVAGEPEDLAIYDLIARGFDKEESDIDVELVGVARGGDHVAKLATAFAGGEPPEVFLINYREYAQFAGQDALEPLEKHLVEAGVELDDYYAAALEAFRIRGKVVCLPQNLSSLVVYYNTALFERAGVDAPAAGWTWADFRDAAQRTTGGALHGLGIEPVLPRIAPFVWANGGEIVDDVKSPTRLTFDDPAAREALAFVVGLARDDKVVPGADDVAAQDLQARFAAGKLAMLLSSRREVPALREVRALPWDVAPLPTGKSASTILHSDGYCLSKNIGEEEMAAAVKFIAYAGGSDGQTVAALGGRTVPSISSVATGAFLDPTRPPEHDQVFLDAIPLIRRTPVISTWPEIERETEEVLTRAFYEEGYTIDEAVADLDARTRPLFSEAAKGE